MPEQPQPQPAQTVLKPFDDGYIFKFCDHPSEPGRFVLFTEDKRPIGVIQSAAIADLICQAVKALFIAHQAQQQARAEQEHAAELAAQEMQEANEPAN